MLAPDINILVGAFRTDADDHDRLLAWLRRSLRDPQGIGLSPLVLTGFVRVMSNSAFARMEVKRADILHFVDRLLESKRTTLLIPGPAAFRVFREFCDLPDVGPKLIADAYHAAIAIEHDCEWITLDRDFGRFPGLRWSFPA